MGMGTRPSSRVPVVGLKAAVEAKGPCPSLSRSAAMLSSMLVEGVGEEDEAIALRLNISESNLACVRHRVDRVEDDVEVLKNRMKGMTIDRGEQVEGAQARIAEELESHDRIAARMDKRGTSTACKECGRKSVRDKFTQTPIRGTSRKFTQTPKTGEPPVRSAYKGPIWNIGQFDIFLVHPGKQLSQHPVSGQTRFNRAIFKHSFKIICS